MRRGRPRTIQVFAVLNLRSQREQCDSNKVNNLLRLRGVVAKITVSFAYRSNGTDGDLDLGTLFPVLDFEKNCGRSETKIENIEGERSEPSLSP